MDLDLEAGAYFIKSVGPSHKFYYIAPNVGDQFTVVYGRLGNQKFQTKTYPITRKKGIYDERWAHDYEHIFLDEITNKPCPFCGGRIAHLDTLAHDGTFCIEPICGWKQTDETDFTDDLKFMLRIAKREEKKK